MTMMQSADRILGRFGTPYTIRKATYAAGPNDWTVGAASHQYYTGQGRQRQFKPSEIVGSMKQDDVLVILEADFPAVPEEGDMIALGTHTADAGAQWGRIVAVAEPMDGAEVAVYRLRVSR